ncbi:unnamed protein product [Heligmosomoides polygyrus]|uniref:GT23 domain-containing protein n=1 Tax=Heligmosomoides polygyrus TaxID=6339 RepID=A0A3P8EJ65_HELPZ|nr:unnamed protein product [Heligmosomoides polygyrus]
MQSITDVIQAKIHRILNVKCCIRLFRVLLCNLDKQCGFGCQLHHVAFCFVTAFGSERTMVLNNDGASWRYSKQGWLGAFLPITRCKYDDVIEVGGSTTAAAVSEQLHFSSRPNYLPLSIPKPLADQLLKLHSNPPAYFISQVASLSISNVPFDKGPVVGLQIRRTDKIGTEAAYHSVEEYMQWTERWFKVDRKQLQNVTRRIFVATDDPSVFPEIQKKYPTYEVYGDQKTAKTAQMESRYTDSSLYGVVRDIRLLSHCNYLVCTFSSQVCRMGYELMQILQGDAGESFHSLDDIYYFGGQHAHEVVAVEGYIPEKSGEIELRVGDIIGIAGNHWNGFSKGKNRRTGDEGVFPSYKVSSFTLRFVFIYNSLKACGSAAEQSVAITYTYSRVSWFGKHTGQANLLPLLSWRSSVRL